MSGITKCFPNENLRVVLVERPVKAHLERGNIWQKRGGGDPHQTKPDIWTDGRNGRRATTVVTGTDTADCSNGQGEREDGDRLSQRAGIPKLIRNISNLICTHEHRNQDFVGP